MANAKQASTQATQTFEAFAADSQKAAKEQFEKLADGFEKVAQFNQGTFDAMVKTSEVATKAAEGIGSELTTYSKKAFEDTVAAAQDLSSAKNLSELFEKQSAFAKTYFDGFVKQTTKFNDMFAASAKDVAKPLNERMSAASEAMKSFSA